MIFITNTTFIGYLNNIALKRGKERKNKREKKIGKWKKFGKFKCKRNTYLEQWDFGKCHNIVPHDEVALL